MMKYVKRIMVSALALLLYFTAALSVNAAGTYFLSEGLYYGVDNGEAFVHGSDGSGWDIVIRDQFLNKYYVTEVEEYAFFENDSIEVLSFYEASHLRSLGDCAFARCTKLKTVDITPAIQEMGMGVFDSCTALDCVRFSEDAVTQIPRQCFYGCTALETVVFLNEPTSIGPLAFGNCTSLQKIEIPDSVTLIEDNAFSGCDSLVIYCTKDSYALTYAIEHHIAYVVTDAEPFTYINGDADGDGDVTVMDVTVIQRKFAELYVPAVDEIAADVDGNGLEITDATFIQRYLSGYDDPYHIGEEITQYVSIDQ